MPFAANECSEFAMPARRLIPYDAATNTTQLCVAQFRTFMEYQSACGANNTVSGEGIYIYVFGKSGIGDVPGDVDFAMQIGAAISQINAYKRRVKESTVKVSARTSITDTSYKLPQLISTYTIIFCPDSVLRDHLY